MPSSTYPRRAVIVPFGVPKEGRGLGLGLAALFHGLSSIDGQSVGIAQLEARPREDRGEAGGVPPGGPLETFLPPEAWRELAAQSGTPKDVSVVVTGAFEPPSDGKGMVHVLAFDAHDGSMRARVEAHVDAARAGESILAAFDDVWTKVGGDLGLVRDIGDLGWDALESVLLAERCVLVDPSRRRPYDRLAALAHLGRAVGDAPEARFPAGRLAALALETAGAAPFDARLAEAALRTLDRAALDAPLHIDLLEANAALHVRLGHAGEGEARASAALERAPERARLYAILSEARRAQGDLDGALQAVDAGLRKVRDDGLLATERGVVLRERGDVQAAETGWRRVLASDSVYPPAYVHLASLAADKHDLLLAQALVDAALSAGHAHPDVLRRAIQLAVATEADGLPRAARVEKLATVLLSRSPADAWAELVLGQARLRTGERRAAVESFTRVMALAPASALAAEAARERLACSDPDASLAVEAVLRAAQTAPEEDLEGVAARALSLARAHGVWTAELARGVAEKRRGRKSAARAALSEAVRLSPGATPAHLELVDVYMAEGDPHAAKEHAERAIQLEGKTPRALAALAIALDAVGETARAKDMARAALGPSPDDPRLQRIAEGTTPEAPPRPSFWQRLTRLR
jgi:tetratricopeptide (TPR) repeat protein